MKQVHEISNIIMVVSYDRYEVDADGVKHPMHSQTLTFDKFMSKEELLEEAKARTDEGIEVAFKETL